MSVLTKAARLLQDERVQPKGTAEVFEVRGDVGTYLVVVGPDFTVCTCRSTVACSHAVAAKTLHERSTA